MACKVCSVECTAWSVVCGVSVVCVECRVWWGVVECGVLWSVECGV